MALTRITKGVIKPNENYDTHDINSTGIITATGANITGNMTVGGVLTYEDVTSIDSVGLITARNGIDCNGDLDVDGHTNLDNVSIAGITTFTNGFVDLKPGNGGNAHFRILSTGSGEAGIFFDAANGDISGSDYAFIGQKNNLDFVINPNANAGNIDFQRAGTTQLRINSSGRVLIGTTTEGAAVADDLTIATSGDTGMTIRSGTTSNGTIYFSDATSGVGEYAGYIDYDHNTDYFQMGVNSNRFLSVDSDLVVSLGKPNFGGASRVIAYGGAGGIDKNSLSVLNPTASVAGRGAGVAVGGNTDILGSFYAKKSGNADSAGGDIFLESVGAMSFITGGDLTNFTNNTASLDITSDGKIGINETSNINGRLHVQHDALGENILYATRYNDQGNDKPILAVTEASMTGMTASGLVIGTHNRGIHIGPVFDASAAVNTAYVNGIRILYNGKVGVNTASPSQQFTSYASSGYPILANGPSNGIGLGNNGAVVFGNKDLASYAKGIIDATELEIKISGTPKVNIDTTGRLLVNRTSTYASSSERLSVNGMTSIQYASTSAAGLYIFNTDTTGSGTVQPYIFLHDGSGIRGGLGLQYSTSNFVLNANNDFQFRTGSSGVGGTERVRINASGNLKLPDSAELQFGGALSSGDGDLRIYHDNSANFNNIQSLAGSNLRIRQQSNGAGLYLAATHIYLQNHNNNQTYLHAQNGGSVTLNYSGNARARTDANGFYLSRVNTFSNPNNTGSETLGAMLDIGGNIHLQEVHPTGAYTDRCDLVLNTNSGYGLGLSDKIRITAGGQVIVGGNVGHNESSALLSVHTDASTGANMLSDSSAIYNHNNPAFLHIANRYNTGTGQEAGIILHSKNSHNGSWAIYSKRSSSSYLADLIFRCRTGSSSSAQRFRMNSSGMMGFNGNPNRYLHVYGRTDGGNFGTAAFEQNNTGNGSAVMFMSTLRDGNAGESFLQCNRDQDNNGQGVRAVFFIRTNGDCDSDTNSYGGISDIKLKENIVDAKSQWDDIKNIKVRNFNFKDNPEQKMLGVVAQEVETVSAGLVKDCPDENITSPGPEGTSTKSVKYSILYMKAIKCLQEAQARIETLEAKVSALEGS